MNTNTTTETRLNALERSLRRTRLCLVGVLALGAVGILLGNAQPEAAIPALIQARAFEVVNDGGDVVVSLLADDAGGLIIVENDDGTPVVTLLADEDGGMVVVQNADGELAADIFVESDGNGRLNAYNGSGIGKLDGLRASFDGSGDFYVWNSAGRIVANTGIGEDGDGHFLLANHQGRKMVYLGGVDNHNGGVVQSFHRNGNHLVSLGCYEDREGFVAVHDEDGKLARGLFVPEKD